MSAQEGISEPTSRVAFESAALVTVEWVLEGLCPRATLVIFREPFCNAAHTLFSPTHGIYVVSGDHHVAWDQQRHGHCLRLGRA